MLYTPIGVAYESPVVSFMKIAVFSVSVAVVAKAISSMTKKALNRGTICCCPLAASACANKKPSVQDTEAEQKPASEPLTSDASADEAKADEIQAKKLQKQIAKAKKKKYKKPSKAAFRKLEKAITSDSADRMVKEAYLNQFRV